MSLSGWLVLLVAAPVSAYGVAWMWLWRLERRRAQLLAEWTQDGRSVAAILARIEHERTVTWPLHDVDHQHR
ncbi:hypothetical protein CFN78_27765 [Amycolatopsis antarctica]|uniref:Uncharacterized protein n=1 Tax=Amycolatopsis antarctica TaxID=1854586 RepID=A0A263CVD2_9PSEU|nr:hypothetical protein [Amycolatopsis antarctica]OZM69948.1 hypothetical protein CFN78_27765 [Amycolatopsis antarctica]